MTTSRVIWPVVKSLLEVVYTVVYFGRKGGKIMHCNTKILPIYKLLKIYKTHTKSHVLAIKTIYLNTEAQNPEAPTIKNTHLIKRKPYICVCVYIHYNDLKRKKAKF